jgi:hypothetical protein
MKRFTKKPQVITYITIISLVFFLAIAFDITPYLRGPVDSLLKSRWPYYYVNTWNKIWLPVVISGGFLMLYIKTGTAYKKLTRKNEYSFLTVLVILVFFLQLSLVYFSRFGITVLFWRMTNPGTNGYFSSAVKVKNFNSLLKNFPSTVKTLDNHARDHPPGSTLLLKGTITFFDNEPYTTNFLSRFVRKPAKKEAIRLWNPLSLGQRIAAVFSAFLFHFFAAITVIPFYFLAKTIFDKRSAINTTVLYALIPGLSFFALEFDPFYTLFSLTGFLAFFSGFHQRKYAILFLSGAIFCVGLFFSLSLLPVLGIVYGYSLFSFIKERNRNIIRSMCFFTSGIVACIGIFYLTGFNFILSLPAILGNQAPRTYLPWLLFNPYDFFVYMGIPFSLFFFYITIKVLRKPEILPRKAFLLFLSFWTVFILLIISGISRGEVGRIWLPLMFLPMLFVGEYITNKSKLPRQQFIILLLLAFIQLIILEEFWVPIW